jgi:tetratricopeptide (TPR) repeat protein
MPVVLLALAAAVLVGPAWAADEASEDAPAADEALRQATEHWQAGRLDEATEVLWVALDAEPDDASLARLEALLGSYLVQRGDPYAALQHLEVAVTKRGDAEDHLALAEALLGVVRDALAGGQAGSLQVTPYLLDATSAAEKSEGDGAIAARRALVLGEVLYWQGELEPALAALAAVGMDDLERDLVRRVYGLRAQILYRVGRHPEAAKSFAAAENPQGEASAWAAAKMPAELAKALELVLLGRPYDATLVDWALQGAVYAGAERELLALMRRLEPAAADKTHHRLVQARLHQAIGEMEAARTLLRDAADQDPGTVEPLLALGRLEYAVGGAGTVDRAVTVWIEALRRDTEDDRALGLLWDQAGRDYGSAWRSPSSLARSLRIQEALAAALDDDGLAWANFGNTLRIAGRLEDALRAYDRAREAEPDDPGILSDRGLVLSALGRKDEALAAFQQATRLDPEHDAAHQNAARALWLAGDDAGAAAHLGRALAATRALGEGAMRYRFLASRVWRTTRQEAWR